MHQSTYLNPQIEKINIDLLYERKCIGRFMMNEKILKQQIDSYKDSVHINIFMNLQNHQVVMHFKIHLTAHSSLFYT